MKRRFVAAMLLCLNGCASTALERYVGGPLDAVVKRYGPPADHKTLPNGEEAFRWVSSASRKSGAAQPPEMFLPVATAPLRRRETAYSAGVLLGGMCIYTLRARRSSADAPWRVVGYERPRLDCD